MDFSRKRRSSSISLVPMIDVLLCLLIFFMLTSQFIHFNELKLSPYQEATGSDVTKKDKTESIVIVLLNKNQVEYQGKKYSLSLFTRKLETQRLSKLSQKQIHKIQVQLTVSKIASLQDLADIMMVIKSMNLKNLQVRQANV
jgi:biopolymer transport protein ExbD